MSAGEFDGGSRVDKNSDGFVDNKLFYTLVSEENNLFLRNWKGRRFSDASGQWKPIRAINTSDGYQVLVEGKAGKKGMFSILDVNVSGRINGKSRWRTQSVSLRKGWEDRFGDVIRADDILGEEKDSDGDGFLDAGQGYRMASPHGTVTLKSASGKALSDKSSKRWDAIRSVGEDNGFQVLLRKRKGRKPTSLFQLLDVDVDGTVMGKSRWKSAAKALFAGWDMRFQASILNDKSSGGGVTAASIGEEAPISQLIYTAAATDLPGVVYSLEPSGDFSLDGLSIDSNLGEVRLTTENLIAIPERVHFRVVATDVAGNSSSLDVVVSLIVETPSETLNPDDGASASGEGTMVSMSSLEVPPSTELTEDDSSADGSVPDSETSEPLSDPNDVPEIPAITPEDELIAALRLDPRSDTGRSDLDGVTRDRTPAFSGVATPGARIELFADSTFLGAAPANSDGEWQLTLSEDKAFVDGRYSITARELKANGEERSRSDALDLVVDGLAPEFTSAASASASLTLSTNAVPPADGVYFVSNDGSDSNPGSFQAPFRTIQHAIDVVKPGDVVSIRGGSYRERLRIQDLNGRDDARITFENYQNENVVLTGADPITTVWQKHDGNIWKTNLDFDVSQLYLDGKMLTAARWPNITKEWDRLDNSDRRNATPDSYWDIEGTRALALVDSELPNVYTNHESKQRLSDLDFSVDGAMLVPHKSFGLTHSGEIINHKAGESSFDIDPNFELWLRSPGQKVLKNFNWISGNDGSVETADLWPTKNGPVQGTRQFHYHLEGHLGFLDRPQEWHYDKESGDLYVWLPDEEDPNLSDLHARAWDRSTSYIADPDKNPDADYHLLLEIEDSSFLDFNGITLHTGTFELDGSTNLNFDQMRFLYPTYDGRMLKDGRRPLYENHIKPVSLKGRPELQEIPDSNISFINSEFANGISGLLRAAGPGLELKNSYLHNVRDRGALRVNPAARMNVERNTFHTFGYGGAGKIGDSSVWRYNHIHSFHGDGDISGIQVPASSQEGALIAYNWIHDAPGRNGIRFDGSPAGIRGTAHHNVARQTRRGMRMKGDQHKIMNNTLVSNFSYDFSAERGKFFGYLDSTPGCMEWECRYKPSVYGKDKNRRLGHFNSSIHNNAFDGMPGAFGVGSPDQAIGNSFLTNSGLYQNIRSTLIKEELRDPENFDFRPREGSPLIDFGMHIPGVTDGYQGEAPDSGAYEFGAGSYWIPGHRTNKARTPIAPNGSTTVKPDADLMWLEGQDVSLNHVYFGEDASNLMLVSSQANNIYTPSEDLLPSHTYYWRIDTETSSGSIIEGDLWSFQVAEALPVMPSVLVHAHPGEPLPIDPVSDSPLPDYDFYIGTYEVTNAQYAQFLNSVASVDDYYLYDKNMGLTDLDRGLGGITREGYSGDYSYSVVPELANHPVTYVSFWDAARYVNWLSTGSTEQGAYTMKPKQDDNKTQLIERNQDAFDEGAFALPSHAEWLKAGLYSSSSDPTLHAFPTQSDSLGVEQANIEGSSFAGLAPVGSFDHPSPHGTYDQAGNAWEWLEDISLFASELPGRLRKGGSFLQRVTPKAMSSLAPGKPRAASDQGSDWGFRVVQKRTANQQPAWKSTSWELDAAYVQESYSSSIADLAFDADGDPLVFSMEDGPDWLKVNGNGSLEGVPEESDLGVHSVVFRVEDSKGDSQTLEIPYTIKVRPDTNPPEVPDSPTLASQSDSGSDDADQLTNQATPLFSGSAEIASTVDIFLDGDLIGRETADDAGQWRFQPGDPLPEGQHQLTVSSVDRAGNASELSAPLVFQLDRSKPVITSLDQAIHLDENSGENQIVYVASASDISSISYEIDDLSDFSIDTETGIVRFLPDPDFEIKEAYKFIVSAIDKAGNVANKSIVLKVKDVDDQAPEFTSGGKASRLKEHSGPGQIVYVAKADDSSKVSYQLVREIDNDFDKFSIDPSSGEVTLLDNPDYETISSYRFAVSAIDENNNVATRKVQLGIKNIDESQLLSDPIMGDDGQNVIDDVTGRVFRLTSRKTYKNANADIISNFNVLEDQLHIDINGFDVQSSPIFEPASSKKLFNQLRRADVDFIYRYSEKSSKPGLLYFNQNGPGRGLGKGGGVLAILENRPELTSSMIEFI